MVTKVAHAPVKMDIPYRAVPKEQPRPAAERPEHAKVASRTHAGHDGSRAVRAHAAQVLSALDELSESLAQFAASRHAARDGDVPPPMKVEDGQVVNRAGHAPPGLNRDAAAEQARAELTRPRWRPFAVPPAMGA